jgi:hypothetical protein
MSREFRIVWRDQPTPGEWRDREFISASFSEAEAFWEGMVKLRATGDIGSLKLYTRPLATWDLLDRFPGVEV